MEEKKIISVLVVNRQIKKGEYVLFNILNLYREKFHLIIFPPMFGVRSIEVSIFSEEVASFLKKSTLFDIQYEEDDEYHYFDLCHVEENSFFDILKEIINFEKFNLTEVENSR